MPYAKKTYTPKRRFVKRRYAKKNNRLVRKVNYLTKLTRPEVKKVDIGFGPSTLSGSSGNVHLITSIGRGDNPDQRQGDKVNCKYHSIKGQIWLNPSISGSTYTKQACRIVVVQDLQQIGDSSPTCLDIFKEISTFSPLNSAHVGRFKILASRNVHYNSTMPTHNFKIFIKKFTQVRFNGSTGGDTQKNHIYICFLPKYTDVFPYESTYEAICRTGYTDC